MQLIESVGGALIGSRNRDFSQRMAMGPNNQATMNDVIAARAIRTVRKTRESPDAASSSRCRNGAKWCISQTSMASVRDGERLAGRQNLPIAQEL